ncbi:MAG TPA: DUF1292 domain-containing protein [Limnochordales bacterium]|nr:DUF1292 domain-containing protein [Limnochordales bacterium]
MSRDKEQWGQEPERITLMGDDGEAREFIIWDMVEVGADQYWLLEPAEPEEGVEEGAWVFRLDTDDDGEQVLTLVEDDDEWERVRQAWEEQNGAE